MKTFDFRKYEKLKIKPINLDEFDNLNIYEISKTFDMSLISQYDIIKTKSAGFYLAMFDELPYSENKKLNKMIDKRNKYYEMFANYNHRTERVSFLNKKNFNKTGENMYNSDYDIVSIYKAPKNLAFDANDSFDSYDIMNLIKTKHYNLIYQKENDINEKLKINPVNVEDFDKCNFYDIEDFDIVKMHNGICLMMFMKDTDISFISNKEVDMINNLRKRIDCDMLICIMNERAVYAKITEFKHYDCITHGFNYDIVKYWKAPYDVKSKIKHIESFEYDKLEQFAEKNGYKLIYNIENK